MTAVDQIKERIELSSIVGNYVQLKKSGINYSGRCPFHREKTPSFYVSDERGTYKCFGCGEGGDVFTFLEKIEGMSFKEALVKLAADTGVTLDSQQQSHSGGVSSEKKQDLYDVMHMTTVLWQKNLGLHPEAVTYLKQRGFSKEQVIAYQIGYAHDQWTQARDTLLARGISSEQLLQCGITKRAEGKTREYDRFRNRIIFPLRDITGRVIAFSGRYMGNDKDDDVAKYLNSPETPLFNKSKELYGLDTARDAIRKNNFAIVVEGQVDLVMSQSVFLNTVATSGTALSESHIKSLSRFCNRIVVIFDSDEAGVNAAHKAALVAFGQGFEVRIGQLKKGQDPADVIVQDPEVYRKVVRDAKDIFDFWIDQVNDPDTKPIYRSKLIETRLLPLIRAQVSSLEQDRYLHHIADKTSYSYEALHDQLSKTQTQVTVTTEEPTEQRHKILLDTGLKRLAGIYAYSSNTYPERFSNMGEELQQLVRQYVERLTDEQREQVLFEIEKEYENDIMIQNDTKELIVTVQNAHKTNKKRELVEQHKQLTREGKHEEAKELFNQISTL